jgi:YHS domain-containing protein
MLKTYKNGFLSIKRQRRDGIQTSFDQNKIMKSWLSLMFLWSAYTGFSQTGALQSKQLNLDDGLAIKGYDPVCYFTGHKAERGRKEFSLSYQGALYLFASAADRQTFQTDPAKYEPQYGGWCAYAMGHDGSKVEVDPETFKIINGKLFLFYNRFFNNTLKSWNQDEPKLQMQADANWKKLINNNQNSVK